MRNLFYDNFQVLFFKLKIKKNILDILSPNPTQIFSLQCISIIPDLVKLLLFS